MEQRELTVLIVEDEGLIAMEIEQMLTDLGHCAIHVATTVEEAMDALDQTPCRIDAVLLDANLAGVWSISVAERLRELEIPFVVASGYGEDELRRLGFCAPRLFKPYNRTQMKEALEAVPAP